MGLMLGTGSLVFDPVLPLPLLLLAAALAGALTFFAYWKIGSNLSRGRRILLGGFRLLGLSLLFLLLLQPSRQEEIPPPRTSRVTLVAVDTSRSMKQTDVGKDSRLDAAKLMLYDTDFAARSEASELDQTRFFEFNNDATAMAGRLENLKAEGSSTRFHRSISSMLNSISHGEEARALVILSDGHDFELTSPAKTGAMARSRGTPIYAVPLGRQGNVRDASVRITNYQPYSYVKQKVRISGVVRLVGCEYEDVTVQLLKKNEVVQTRRLNAGESNLLPVEFEVVEPEVGQFEYEIRVLPLEHETNLENNSALTYLNVIDQQIQILLLEGAPYWDTTFLQRSLAHNDKISLDCVLQYAEGKARVVRKQGSAEDFKIPATQEEFNHYDVVILGREVNRILDPTRAEALRDYVKEHGGTVIFSRGKAFGDAANELEPVIWENETTEHVTLQVSREGQAIAPFKVIADQNKSLDAPPDLIAGHKVQDRKPLAAVLAQAQNRDNGETMPGFVHRRFGQGQVLSVGVEGLWRWAFNAKIEGINSVFDRFWDQMVLWLMAGRDFTPNKQFSFRCSSANVLLGEKVYFKLVMRAVDPQLSQAPVSIYRGDKELERIDLIRGEGQGAYRLGAEFLPDKPGKYRAVALLPNGVREESKFIVFDDNQEETEVATDAAYLKKLCETSGGRLLTPGELKKLSAELDQKQVQAAPKIRVVTIWDRGWIFYLIGLAFGIDWYCRRKWGLC